MPRHEFDKSSKWLVQQHGNAVLYLGGVRDVHRWHALQAEVVQPRQLPDGLLEVYFDGRKTPDYFLIEVATYPEKRVEEQAADDLMLASQHLGVLPELLIVVLAPKGQYRVRGRHQWQSRLGWSKLVGEWNVVELWTVPAEDLLAAGDVGLVPWVPLAQSSQPPEVLLRECCERIERQAPPDERDNLLAVSQVLARLRHTDPDLLALLGGKRVMLESPLIRDLLAENTQEAILKFLRARFGGVPLEVEKRLRRYKSEKRLNDLVEYAATCRDLKAFREKLLS
jgi:hypothetical protein